MGRVRDALFERKDAQNHRRRRGVVLIAQSEGDIPVWGGESIEWAERLATRTIAAWRWPQHQNPAPPAQCGCPASNLTESRSGWRMPGRRGKGEGEGRRGRVPSRRVPLAGEGNKNRGERKDWGGTSEHYLLCGSKKWWCSTSAARAVDQGCRERDLASHPPQTGFRAYLTCIQTSSKRSHSEVGLGNRPKRCLGQEHDPPDSSRNARD